MTAQPLWTPSPERVANATMTAFRRFCADRTRIRLADSVALHGWSVAEPAAFGPRGVLDRFGQIEPKVLITVDGFWYAGKRCALADKLAEIVPMLPSVARVVVIDCLGDGEALAATLPRAATLEAFLRPFAPAPLVFARLPFDHPLYILFSSGTTGVPKCIVHRAGGVLLQHLKEHALHADTRAGDRVFYFTTLALFRDLPELLSA